MHAEVPDLKNTIADDDEAEGVLQQLDVFTPSNVRMADHRTPLTPDAESKVFPRAKHEGNHHVTPTGMSFLLHYTE